MKHNLSHNLSKSISLLKIASLVIVCVDCLLLIRLLEKQHCYMNVYLYAYSLVSLHVNFQMGNKFNRNDIIYFFMTVNF